MGKQQAAVAAQQNCSEQETISAQQLHTKSGFESTGTETQTEESKITEAWNQVGITQHSAWRPSPACASSDTYFTSLEAVNIHWVQQTALCK